ncbi:MAG: hypothetical protein WBD22_06330 [Pyrinomonadaceae bacterium]
MNRFSKFVVLGFMVAGVAFTAGCPERTTIADVEANPSKYVNKEIAVAGVVKDSYGLSIPGTPIRGGIYKVDDGTGSIWVVTEDTVPNKGAEVGVQGRIGNGISWNGRNYGLGMYEENRKFRRK